MDTNADWQIDALQVTMSENIIDSTVVLSDFNISWVWVPSWKSTWGVSDDNVFVLTFADTWDTSTSPTLTYTSWTLTDLASKLLVTTNNFNSTDKAVPRLLSSAIYDDNWNWKFDKIIATFSEILNSSTDSSVWTINNALSWMSISSVSTSWNTAIINLNETTSFETAVWTMDLLFISNSNWKDTNNNQAWSASNVVITDLAKPVILSSQYTDNNSNYIADKVTITLSENINWFDIANFALTGLIKNNWSVTNNVITINLTEAWSNDSWVVASFDYTSWTLNDWQWNLVNTTNSFSIDDKIAPELLTKETIDSDSNWQIDTIKLTFSEDLWLDFSSFVAEVDWYTLVWSPYVKNWNTVVEVSVEEKTSSDTWVTPLFRISSNSSLKDNSWNNIEVNTFTALTDNVWPIIISARYNSTSHKMFLLFSEVIDNADFLTWNFTLNNAWSYSVIGIDSWEKSITLSNETVIYWSTEVSFTSNSVWDTLWNKQAWTTYTKTSAPIVINEVMISTTENNNYIELKNLSSSIVDISWWTVAWVIIPATTNISANGYILISESTAATSIINVVPDIIDSALDLTWVQIALNDWLIDIDYAKLNTWLNDTVTPKSIERQNNPWDWSLTSSWYQSQSSVWFDDSIPFWTPWSVNVFDTTAPTINSYFPSDNDLLPMWDFNLSFDYTENVWGLWVDITSDNLTLYKYNTWTTSFDINSISSVNLWWKIITTTKSSYPINNLAFWKYQAIFTIDDLAWNTVTKTLIFYVDEFEFIVNSNILDIWTLIVWNDNISISETIVTIKTVWAWFSLNMDKLSLLTDWSANIVDWNWSNWFGFDLSKDENWSVVNYLNSLTALSSNNLWSITKSINTDWDKNVFTYSIKYWANINTTQSAWTYNSNVDFDIGLTY